MKIIHTADLHLNSKMQTSLSAEKATERKEELMSTFRRMTKYAKENAIDAFIIAGDIFDGTKTPMKTVGNFIDCIKDCPETDFYCICGNHDADCLKKFGDIPQNLKLFEDGWSSYTKGNVAFTGRDTISENMYGELALDPDLFNIVILHGSILPSGAQDKDKITLSMLADKKINYLALGHIHSFDTQPFGEKGIACYPGCPEGRGFDECGIKGFVLVDTEKKGADMVQFVPVCKRQLHKVKVEIDQNDGRLSDFEKKIDDAVSEIPSSDMVEATLCGKFRFGAEKDITLLSCRLNEKFYFARIKDNTSLYIDENDYIGDITLKGSFMRIIANLKAESEDDFLRDVAECGIRALRGEDIE